MKALLAPSLLLLAALSTACAAPAAVSPVAPAPPAFGVVPPMPEPRPAPPVAADPPPAPEKEQSAKLQLAPAQAEIKLGARGEVALTNVDDHAFRYHFPGASNGCGGFRWGVTLIDARGRGHVDHYRSRGMLCATVMLPDFWLTIEPGQATAIAIDAGKDWYELTPDVAVDRTPALKPLAAGVYELVVSTPFGEVVRGKVRILPRA